MRQGQRGSKATVFEKTSRSLRLDRSPGTTAISLNQVHVAVRCAKILATSSSSGLCTVAIALFKRVKGCLVALY